jgi:hypothetical protein
LWNEGLTVIVWSRLRLRGSVTVAENEIGALVLRVTLNDGVRCERDSLSDITLVSEAELVSVASSDSGVVRDGVGGGVMECVTVKDVVREVLSLVLAEEVDEMDIAAVRNVGDSVGVSGAERDTSDSVSEMEIPGVDDADVVRVSDTDCACDRDFVSVELCGIDAVGDVDSEKDCTSELLVDNDDESDNDCERFMVPDNTLNERLSDCVAVRDAPADTLTRADSVVLLLRLIEAVPDRETLDDFSWVWDLDSVALGNEWVCDTRVLVLVRPVVERDTVRVPENVSETVKEAMASDIDDVPDRDIVLCVEGE